MPLLLKNPHSVSAVLQTRPQDILEIILPEKKSTEAWESVRNLAGKRGVRISHQWKGVIENGKSRSGIAQAWVKEKSAVSLESLFALSTISQSKNLWLALDCLQDPHNVGAIFRAASFFGVQGILMTEERSSSMTSTVYDVASGGVEFVPFSIQTNLHRALEFAKTQGIWILGSSEHANDDISSIQNDRPWILVLGNEERGMRRLTEETCDVLCKVTNQGQTSSLNVSVATGIFIFELTKAVKNL